MADKNTLMAYKGYYGSIAASIEDNCLYGKLEYIRPLVSYEGQTLAELQAAFEGAVEAYLVDCVSEGAEPEKPCKGSFNIRIGQERHLQLAMYVGKQAKSINELVIQAIDHELERLSVVGGQ
jgi:predicted HicB family RNase H-like nuclease